MHHFTILLRFLRISNSFKHAKCNTVFYKVLSYQKCIDKTKTHCSIWASLESFWCKVIADYPVENLSPALHGNALEHSEHGKQKIVEVGDAVVGALPALSANCAIEQAMTAVPWYRTRCGLFLHEGTCGKERQMNPFFRSVHKCIMKANKKLKLN